MAIVFNELAKTSVHIGIGNGQYIEVPMLTVADYSEYQQLQYNLAKLDADKTTSNMARIDAIIAARNKLAAMAKKVMPVEMHDKVQLMDYPTLSMLVMVLCSGNDDGEKDDATKKVTLPSKI